MEKTWDSAFLPDYHQYKQDLQSLKAAGAKDLRLPVDLQFYISNSSKAETLAFKKSIRQIIRFTARHKMSIILSNFNHGLDQSNYKSQGKRIAQEWLELLDFLNQNKLLYAQLYIDLVNEPVLYPLEWEETAQSIIGLIRKEYPDLKIIYGSSNYNSMYELSRMNPLPYKSIIYSFHFYEPFLFTHQGTPWTGDQNATTGIPFPYPHSTAVSTMPPLASKALGTAGAINYRDYSHTGTYQAIRDKLAHVNDWKTTHGVDVWCTEYGVTQNADPQSRKNYLKAVGEVLKDFGIKGYIWEYKGNFGVDKLNFSEIFK